MSIPAKAIPDSFFDRDQRLSSVRQFTAKDGNDGSAWLERMWRERKLGDDLVVTALGATSNGTRSVEFAKNNPFIDFGFFLEGVFVNRIDSLERKTVEFENREGEFGIGYIPEMRGSVHLPDQRKLRVVHVHVQPNMLLRMFGQDWERVSPTLRAVLDRGKGSGFVHQYRQTPLVQAVANELFYAVCNNRGVGLYVEGKVSELLALVLAETVPRAGCTLNPKLKDIIAAIRDELEKTHAAPPTLFEISSKYQVPVATIQAGFKSLFGMPVFAYVKEFRLQLARKLFVEGDMNVSEVAWDLGYTNVSHFSSAYKKRFGVLPKAYLQSVRERLHTP